MDYGRPDPEERIALGRSHGVDEVDEAVASWRRHFFDVDAIRSDDIDELCDHFRDVLEA